MKDSNRANVELNNIEGSTAHKRGKRVDVDE